MFNQTEKSAITVVWPHNTKLLPVYSNSLITQPMENDFHSQCLDTLKKKRGVIEKPLAIWKKP